MQYLPRILTAVIVAIAVLLHGGAARAAEPAAAASPEPATIADPAAFFDSEVKPLLAEHCLKCHGAEGKPKGSLFLTSREGILKGGDSGSAVSLETPLESLLLEAVNYTGYEMPPSGKLADEQIAVLTKWVELGLPWGSEFELAEKPADEHGPPAVDEAAKAFWSFQPVTAPAVPKSNDNDWVRTPIDAFVLSKLKAAGLQPAPVASKAALLRRAYYDLIGLPPSPEEVEAFLADESPGAFERVVDPLLESPHYGERWGRHWLDLVRYAETNSYERDGAKPFVWRYRDYVIRSFNDDKPYDQFVTEQLAGDELDQPTPETIIATGYYRLGIWQDEPVDPEQELYEDLDDLVRTTGEVFLGLTIGCARCHDHKLDPFPQADYYRLLAFFRNVRRFGVRSQESIDDASVCTIGNEEEVRRNDEQIAAHKQHTKEVRQELRKLDERIFAAWWVSKRTIGKPRRCASRSRRQHIGGALSQEEFDRYAELMAKRDELAKFRPAGSKRRCASRSMAASARRLTCWSAATPTRRQRKSHPVSPRCCRRPSPPSHFLPKAMKSTGRRRALAQWITSPENPLTARVMVNRIWHYHFGRGIVRSTSDFGFQGIQPTHPELLDWLASEFVAGGWRHQAAA